MYACNPVKPIIEIKKCIYFFYFYGDGLVLLEYDTVEYPRRKETSATLP
jgi:hypothetical protein